MGCQLTIDVDKDYEVTGNRCQRGITYGKKELLNPTRTITSTVKVTGGAWERIPVKTDQEVPKAKIFDVMQALNEVQLNAPVHMGQVIIKNVAGTKANIVTTRSMQVY
jgi:CxxC motif-containing protein